jgi:hypothetical protein
LKDWQIVEAWLGCKGRDLNDADFSKIEIAYRSYLARGIAPSIGLESAFAKFKETVRSSGRPIDNPPTDVIGVFDRLLASEEEINQKRALKAMAFASALDELGKEPSSSLFSVHSELKGLQARLRSLSRVHRLGLVVSLLWAVVVIYRTASDHEFLGIDLYQWEDDSFLLNLLIVPVAFFTGAKLYRWIMSVK